VDNVSGSRTVRLGHGCSTRCTISSNTGPSGISGMAGRHGRFWKTFVMEFARRVRPEVPQVGRTPGLLRPPGSIAGFDQRAWDNPRKVMSEDTVNAYRWLQELMAYGPTKGQLCDCGCRKASHGSLGCECCDGCARTFTVDKVVTME